MEPAAAKLIGAGIACIGMGGAGVGVGVIFGNYLAAAVRNPSAAQGQFGNLIFGFAVTEALGIFSLLAESHGDAKGHQAGAHTEADGGHGGAFPPFDSSTFASQLVSLLIAFVALYLIVSRIALPRVGSVLDARAKAIEGDLAKAQELKDASDAALKAYETELAAARARAQAISAETREKLNAASEAERKTLEERLAVKLAEAEKTIASTREAAMRNVRGIAADAAAAIVQRLTGILPDGKSLESAVDASLKG
jgi:F-type H+-transporting ATPase subunit b